MPLKIPIMSNVLYTGQVAKILSEKVPVPVLAKKNQFIRSWTELPVPVINIHNIYRHNVMELVAVLNLQWNIYGALFRLQRFPNQYSDSSTCLCWTWAIIVYTASPIL
jgi:hypothetical protein